MAVSLGNDLPVGPALGDVAFHLGCGGRLILVQGGAGVGLLQAGLRLRSAFRFPLELIFPQSQVSQRKVQAGHQKLHVGLISGFL